MLRGTSEPCVSGKTLAFGLPALARLVSQPVDKKAKGTTVSVLVMAPTRELAIQTHETLDKLGEPFGIASVAVYGGVDKGPQIKALKNMNRGGKLTRIVVGTPGRILDLANEGACDLSRVSYLVLDEADRMLDKGFENDIRNIIGRTMQGADRQTLMCKCSCASLGVDAGCAHRAMQSARRGRMPFGGSLRPSSATRSGLLSAATT